MARLRVKKNQTFPEGWHKTVAFQISEAEKNLAPNVKHFAEGIHEARTCCKKVRAALRLVRDEIGDETYRRENAFFRDIARQISEIRDAQVLHDTLSTMRADCNGKLDTKAVDVVQENLRARLKKAEKHMREERALLNSLQAQLKEAKPRLDELPIRDEFEALAPGLRRVYKDGRDLFVAPGEETSAEEYHEWRKCAKYLRYQMDLLKVLWPGPIDAYILELKALSDLLGEDHDLFVLQELLRSDAELAGLGKGVQTLHKVIAMRRKKLQGKMPQLGALVYAETPKQFLARHEAYWQVRQR